MVDSFILNLNVRYNNDSNLGSESDPQMNLFLISKYLKIGKMIVYTLHRVVAMHYVIRSSVAAELV